VVAYRYCDELAEKARRGLDIHHREFVAYHGDDLAVYPNGLAMASDLQKEWRLQWQSQPAEAVARAMAEHKDYHLDYLLRRYKGAYYRKRHPRIALV